MERNVLCRTTPVSRTNDKGRIVSAVAGAAYRAGENHKGIGQGKDGRDKWFSYSNRADTVRKSFIMASDDAPDYLRLSRDASAADVRVVRGRMWNEVDVMEKGPKARLAREVELGFAYELPKEEQEKLLREFVQREIVNGGKQVVHIHKKPVEVDIRFVADVAIHDYGKTIPSMGGSDEQKARLKGFAERGVPFLEREQALQSEDAHVMIVRNSEGNVTGYQNYQPHAHVRITPRAVVDGDWSKNKHAARHLNLHEVAMAWRYEWPKLHNEYLERAGSDVRVRATGAHEDQFPIGLTRGKKAKAEIYAIEERAHNLSDEDRQKHEEAKAVLQAENDLRDAEREAVRRYHIGVTRTEPEEAEEPREMRIARFYKNVSQRLSHMRDQIPEKAAEWNERFKGMKDRMRVWLGYEHQQADKPDERPEPERPDSEPSSQPEQER